MFFSISFYFLVPPSISPFTMGEVSEGDRIQVMCSIRRGDPPFTIGWYKDGVPLARSEQRIFKRSTERNLITQEQIYDNLNDAYSKLLNIGNITESKSEMYMLRSSNGNNSRPAKKYIKILDRVKYSRYRRSTSVSDINRKMTDKLIRYVNNPTEKRNKSHDERSSIHSRTVYSPRISRSNIIAPRWRGDGNRDSNSNFLEFMDQQLINANYKKNRSQRYVEPHVLTDPDLQIRHIDQFSVLLVVSKANSHHSGNYTCQGSNKARTATYSAQLIVKGIIYTSFHLTLVSFKQVQVINVFV